MVTRLVVVKEKNKANRPASSVHYVRASELI